MENFKESIKVNLEETKLTEREARQTYEKYVLEQQEQFVLFINYLNQYINSLREQGIISPFLKFYARVKATNSALKNYEKKALDDIFGIEFICATDEEIKILQEKLEPLLKSHKIKIHNKENGYKAIHHSCSIKQEIRDELTKKMENKSKVKQETFPVIEVQYKTIGVYYEAVYGKASHEKYKDTKLPQLQLLYDNDCLTVGEYIPYMWISNADTDNVRELSTEEVLRKMYPSLKLGGNKAKKETAKTEAKKQTGEISK